VSDRHRMLLITTGGTIGGQVAVDKQDERIVRTAEEFGELVRGTISYLNERYDIDIELSITNPYEEDSSSITPKHWVELASLIKENYDRHDSFIITRGTNTLAYTCAALSCALLNLAKPIILTGSQVPAGLPGSVSAMTNLQNAICVAAWRRPRNHQGGDGCLR
jgi:L-asparaginase